MSGIVCADAAGGVPPTLPMRKRKKPENYCGSGLATPEPTEKVQKTDEEDLKPIKRAPMSKAREVRLEQNRKAARESRRRKKVMIEELQRSVIFFSRANGTLKQQNEELTRLLVTAQAQVAAIENGQKQPEHGLPTAPEPTHTAEASPAPAVKTEGEQQQQQGDVFQQAQAQAVATQAMYESQGFPAAAARAAAQTINAGAPTAAAPAPNACTQVTNQQTPQPTQVPPQPVQQVPPPPAQHVAPQTTHQVATQTTQVATQLNQQVLPQQNLPSMQPGATMQAMANFQQAAAAAMQAAVQGMQGIPGVSMNSLAATPMGANPQQAYTDTMTAFAMQQAAAAAAGQQFAVFPPGSHFMAHPMVSWQNSAAPVTVPAPAGINSDKAQPQHATV